MTSEVELVERLRKGEHDVLGALFSLHRERLWQIVHFRLDPRLRGRVDADDVLQEAFIAATQRIPHFLEGENWSIFVWLRLIVNQTLIDIHRQHLGAQIRDANRERSLQHAPNPNTTASLVIQLLDKMASPSQVMQREEMADRLEEALKQMDPVDQEVLALRHFEELTNNEVAEVLGIQPKAASIRYVRAIKRLRDVLSSLPGFLDSQWM
jgi:RNA polymerase sigma-70 factor (ECF subfamily)